ncbi:ESX secretion-associated protein EspG [Rhodococcus olei]|uniref:ESX secretion-associated protein EspG n=1 Tax=Rhodococcus olei TaxID=2161675 RepID=UPI0031EAD107
MSHDELELLGHVLSIDELPVVLAATPRFDSVSDREAAFARAHASLAARGLLPAGHPDPGVADLLAVLARPTTELALRRYTGAGEASRMCAVRGDTGTSVAALRGPASYVLTELDAIDPVLVLDVLGHRAPLDIGALRAPTEPLAAAMGDLTDPPAVARRLSALGCARRDADRLAVAFAGCIGHAEIVAITHEGGGRRRITGPVTVFDTPAGRIVGTSTVSVDGTAWTTLGPGGDARVRQAIRDLLPGSSEMVTELP